MRRTCATILAGLLGALFIWVATPVNNLLLGNAFISDDYLPVGAAFVMLVLVLGINPLLCRWAPRYAFTGKQFALVFGILLIASVTPGQGLLRQLPYSLARSVQRVSQEKVWAERYEAMNPPAALFPGTLAHGAKVPAADKLLDKLDPGESIPWRAWLRPLLAWGGLLVPLWAMMLAMAVIFLPQWRDKERVAMPLLEVHRLLVGAPEKGRCFPSIFRNRLFLVSCGVVLLIHSMGCAATYWPDRIPAIPLTWHLNQCFTEGALRHVPWYMQHIPLHFIYVGIAYFMNNRVGFSIWSMQFLIAIWIVLAKTYSPPFRVVNQMQLQLGASVMIPLVVLWLSRQHLKHVAVCMGRGAKTEADRMYRTAGLVFIASLVCLVGWLLWVHVTPLWALGIVVGLVLFALLITRLVAETGLPLIAPGIGGVYHFISILPVAWRTAASMFFAGIGGFLATQANRVCAATVAIHALGLDPDAAPKKQTRVALLLLIVLILSLVVCGGAHLMVGYNFDTMLNGSGTQISGDYGIWAMLGNADQLLARWHTGNIVDPGPGNGMFILYGALLALVLYVLCLSSPKWPLHPVALVFVGGWYAWHIWFNVLLGWSLRLIITKYGGARVCSRARPLFLGMIIGEVMAVVIWVLFGAIRAAMGLTYQAVNVLPY